MPSPLPYAIRLIPHSAVFERSVLAVTDGVGCLEEDTISRSDATLLVECGDAVWISVDR
jgi:hypothetical protein